MRINQFFTEKIGVPLHDPRKSWGVFKEESNQVFLRIGDWSIDDYSDGKRWAIVLRKSEHPETFGEKERKYHLELIRRGAKAYAIVVSNNGAGKIGWFDENNLLRLGNIVTEEGATYAEIIGQVSLGQVVSVDSDFDSLESDIAQIKSQNIPETVRQSLINARKGQGKFRQDLLKIWEHRCAVTGSTTTAVIRASHIKPWKNSTNEERLNPRNGLPLIATLDALFDKGLITFSSDGKMCISSKLSKNERNVLGLSSLRLLNKLNPKTQEFLSFHSKSRFQP